MAEQDRDQKTEEPTARRLREAREEGQVPLSTELVAALSLCAGMAVMTLAGGRAWERVARGVVQTIGDLPTRGRAELDVSSAAGWLRQAVAWTAEPILVLVVPVLAVMALASYGQVGFQLATKAVRFDPAKLDPIKGFRRLFSARGAVRTALAAAKVAAIATTIGLVAWRQVPAVVAVGTSELGPLLRALGVVALRCTAAAVIVILALAALDVAFQRWQFRRDQRMTKEEVKEEHRLTDGDPRVKARIRRIQVEMATRRMMADVPRATVVVTNPTHYAVALRYERGASAGAPVVVAKGADAVAQRIKAVAREAGVHCHEDVPLARALFRQSALGAEIPEELFAAVAAVLAHVYRLREGRSAAAAA